MKAALALSPRSSDTGEPRPSVDARTLGRLAMRTGLFALLWAAIVVLMIVRPGSSTAVGA